MINTSQNHRKETIVKASATKQGSGDATMDILTPLPPLVRADIPLDGVQPAKHPVLKITPFEKQSTTSFSTVEILGHVQVTPLLPVRFTAGLGLNLNRKNKWHMKSIIAVDQMEFERNTSDFEDSVLNDQGMVNNLLNTRNDKQIQNKLQYINFLIGVGIQKHIAPKWSIALLGVYHLTIISDRTLSVLKSVDNNDYRFNQETFEFDKSLSGRLAINYQFSEHWAVSANWEQYFTSPLSNTSIKPSGFGLGIDYRF